MKIIPSVVHGVLDYIVGIALLLAPNIFGFTGGPAAAIWVARVVGVVILLQALCTDYQLGAVKMIRFHMHLMADYGVGIFLAASPWLFGFHDQPNNVWVPHLVVGLFILLSTAMTNPTVPGTADH
jgi:uncharacterized membrane protein YtjA (UPF0391 family)